MAFAALSGGRREGGDAGGPRAGAWGSEKGDVTEEAIEGVRTAYRYSVDSVMVGDAYLPGPWVASASASLAWMALMRISKVVPSLELLTLMSALSSSTIFLAAANPRPVPP